MQAFASEDEAEVARLLRKAAPATPSAALRQRVYQNLGASRRLGPKVMRLATTATIPALSLAILGAALAAYLGPRAETRARTQPGRSSPPLPASPAPGAAMPAIPPSPSPPSPSDVHPAGVSLSTGATKSKHADVPSRSAAIRRQPRTTDQPSAKTEASDSAAALDSTEARVAAAPPEEAALVLAGLRALRREHDPTRAGSLLTRYLERFPGGVLTEEAMAIAIEAGLARADPQAAIGLARQYLERFPAGRFVRVARKAVDQQRP